MTLSFEIFKVATTITSCAKVVMDGGVVADGLSPILTALRTPSLCAYF